jgi:signal transduction histidine kinase
MANATKRVVSYMGEQSAGVSQHQTNCRSEPQENAHQAVNLFLANMSHEFRTPLGAIIGYSDMLSFMSLNPGERAQVTRPITRNARHLLALINDILDLTKFEAGKMALEIIPFRLWRVVSEAVSAAEVKASEKNIQLDAIQSGDLPRMLTPDPTRLRQILDNLLANAIKFSDSGSKIQFHIALVSSGVDSKNIQFVIKDQGPGMNREVLSRLFQPFMQADVSTTPRFGGTGLGLSICQRFATALE